MERVAPEKQVLLVVSVGSPSYSQCSFEEVVVDSSFQYVIMDDFINPLLQNKPEFLLINKGRIGPFRSQVIDFYHYLEREWVLDTIIYPDFYSEWASRLRVLYVYKRN